MYEKQEFKENVIVTLLILLLGPVLIIVGIMLAIYACVYLPYILVAVMGIVIWRQVTKKKKAIVIPAKSKPITKAAPIKPHKPTLIKWGGKEIPVSVFVCSMIVTIVMVAFLIIAVFLFIPLHWLLIILAIAIVIGIAKGVDKK